MQNPHTIPFVLTTADGFEVAHSLSLGKHLFGGAPQSDVVLPDLNHERLFGVVIENKNNNLKITVMAFEDNVKLNGKILEKNKFITVKKDFKVSFEGMHVVFGEGKTVNRPQLPAILIAASVALMVVSFFINQSAEQQRTLQIAQVEQKKIVAQKNSVEKAKKEAIPLSPQQKAQLFAEDLKRRLLSNDLADKLRVGTQNDKVFVTGTLNQDQSYRWRDVVMAAKKRYDGVAVQSEVTLARGTSDFAQQVAAVSLTPNKFIIAKDGLRYTLGDVMPDGWKIENIGSFGLVLSKDGFEETVKF